MGSFSIVNPSSGYALTVTDDMCKALSSHADDFTSERQQFYLGQHGSIFSKFCPGHVIAVDASNSIKLEMFLLGATNLKWKFTKGTIESVKVAGMVIECGDSCATITMSTFTAASNQIWRRINARLLDTNSGSHSKGKQEWSDSFTTAIYGNAILEDLHQKCGTNAESQIPFCRQRLARTCYKQNPAFSASFDRFARELVISDPTDEVRCRQTRVELGFDRDHPFDTDIQVKFNEHMCDPFFSGVDHQARPLAAAPQFETVEHVSVEHVVPVEYEAVEYDGSKHKTVDYEEFTRYVLSSMKKR